MALFESNEIILKAQLTKRGKELILGHNEKFLITKFSLGDGEINYNLGKANDTDQSDIESLTVFEPSTNPDGYGISSKLIRSSENIEEIIIANQNKLVPNTEVQVKTQISGSAVFSLQNWKVDTLTISFALLSPLDNSYFLSSAFLLDFSNFYNKHNINDSVEGVAFDFLPVFPSTTLGGTNKYWYNTTTDYKNKSENVLPVIIGIDDTHRSNPDDTPLRNLVNELNIPILTFKLKLFESQVRDIYMYLLNNNLSSITENIIIRNDDKTVVPVTDFFGSGASFQSISTTIPVTITF